MATEFLLSTGQLTPKDKGGPRAGIGCKGIVKRAGDGSVTIQIYQGDGGGPESFPIELRSRTYPGFDAVPLLVELATIDFVLPDFTPRGYQMRVTADGATLTVTDALIAPEPFAAAGVA